MRCSSTWEGHQILLKTLFKVLQAAGLTLKRSEVQFGPRDAVYVGHVVTADGIRIDDVHIKSLVGLPTPETVKEMRSVLAKVNFVRKYI